MKAKSSQEASREALKIDFGPQDSDFGGQETDFGGQNERDHQNMSIFEGEQWNGGGPLATPRVQRVQLEYRKVPYAGHP